MDRVGDVLHLLWPQILERCGHAVSDRGVDRFGNGNASWGGNAFEPGGDTHSLAVDTPIGLLGYVAEVHADAKPQLAVGRLAVRLRFKGSLNLDCRVDGTGRRPEYRQHGVTRGIDHPALVRMDRSAESLPCCVECSDCRLLVLCHQTGIASGVRRQDGGETLTVTSSLDEWPHAESSCYTAARRKRERVAASRRTNCRSPPPIFNRFNPAYEEAARDLGATGWQGFRYVVLPLIAPSIVGIGMFGFTLSWDEIARTSQAIGDVNTLPLELQGLTTTVTTPSIYALGTVTMVVSFVVMGLTVGLVRLLQRRQRGKARSAPVAASAVPAAPAAPVLRA